jgi:hypothetical protein
MTGTAADETQPQVVETPPHKTLMETLQDTVLTSIPVLSALVFLIVSIKVFRVSGMETTTTVAVVSQADPFALLKGVILTLLPAFLEAATAAALWAWARILPTRDLPEGQPTRDAARRTLLSREAGVAWSFIVIAFFTVTWVVFLLFFLAAAVTTGMLWGAWRSQRPWGRRMARLRRVLTVASFVAAFGAVLSLMLASTPWLPLRQVTVAPEHTLTLNGTALPTSFGAYVLKNDDKGTSLLLDDPRAVIDTQPGEVEKAMPFCIPSPGSGRWYKIRASQVVGLDENEDSPYPVCPGGSSQ